MLLYSEFRSVEEGRAAPAVIASDKSVFVVLGEGRRVDVVVRAQVADVVDTDDWSVDGTWASPTDSASRAVVTSALVAEVQRQVPCDDGETGWTVCEETLPALLPPLLSGDLVTWRGEVELPLPEQSGSGHARRLRISEIDWFDGPTTLPALGTRPAPFVCHVQLD